MARARKWIWFLGVGVVLASLGIGWFARAAIDNSRTWGTIPYRGHIELDGAVQDTPVDLVVSLWDAPSGGTKLWEETQLAVPVRSGDFSVKLGSVTALSAAVEQARDLFLAIEIRQAGGSSYEPLSGRQALGGVPFAFGAKRGIPGERFASDGLDVLDGGVRVFGSSEFAGGVSVTGALTSTDVAASGAMQAGELRGPIKAFGPWDATVTFGTTYQAATDGFVLAGTDSNSNDTFTSLRGYTDGAANPTTERGAAASRNIGTTNYNIAGSFTMPVRKGDYWKVIMSASASGSSTRFLYWIPLGT